MSDATIRAGYSGKPVWRKLGLDASRPVLVDGEIEDYAGLVGLAHIQHIDANAAFETAHLFVRDAHQLEARLKALSARLPDHGFVWVSWPKKSSRVPTDITEDTIRAHAFPLGLVDIKVCAIDAVWSALKLVRRRENRSTLPRPRTRPSRKPIP